MSVRDELLKEKADLTSTMSPHGVVKGKEKGDRQWKEMAELITFSPTGSSFNLSRQCDVGTLVSLIIPLPAHMRCYDYDKEFYRVWGLIQHCEPMTNGDGDRRFHVGVAFTGKKSPDSYRKNPMQHYRIAGVGDNGMWAVEELKTPFKKRSDLRFWKQLELYLALIDTKDGSTGGERTTTENVSRNGAAVFTTMNVQIGDRVKFISAEYDFSGLAVVSNRQTADDGRTRLHLNFVGHSFPVESLMTPDAVFERI